MHASTLPYLAARRLAGIILPLVVALTALAATTARANDPVFVSLDAGPFFPSGGSSSMVTIRLAEPLPPDIDVVVQRDGFWPFGVTSFGDYDSDPLTLEGHMSINHVFLEWEHYTLSAVSDSYTNMKDGSWHDFHTEASTDVWGCPNPLAISAQPSGAVSGQPLTAQPVIVATDNYWGRYQDGQGLNNEFNGYVTASLVPDEGTPGAKLTGTVVVKAVNGIATFTDLAIDKPGQGYVLIFQYQSYVTSGASTHGGYNKVGTGRYSAPFSVTPGSVYGDADGDHEVTVQDAVKTLRLPAGLGTASDIGLLDVAPRTAPGVYGDGKVDLLDVVRILRHVSGLETEWPG